VEEEFAVFRSEIRPGIVGVLLILRHHVHVPVMVQLNHIPLIICIVVSEVGPRLRLHDMFQDVKHMLRDLLQSLLHFHWQSLFLPLVLLVHSDQIAQGFEVLVKVGLRPNVQAQMND